MIKVGGSCSSGRVSPDHDARRTWTKNVDRSLTKDNVCLIDELHGMSVYEYIDKLMQPDIDEYNRHQRRKDRRIEVPYTQYYMAQKSLRAKAPMVREVVYQYGEHETLGGEYYSDTTTKERKKELKEEFKTYYKEALEDFQKSYPHLKVLYAYIHFDEKNGTPHMHMAFIPIGEGYKQGLKHQISTSKALECDGILRSAQRGDREGYQLTRLYRQIRDKFINPTLRAMGYELKEEISGKRHEEPTAYERIMDEADKTLEEAKVQADSIVKKADEQKKVTYGEINSRIKKYNNEVHPKIEAGKARLKKLEAEIEERKSQAIDMVFSPETELLWLRETVKMEHPECLEAFDRKKETMQRDAQKRIESTVRDPMLRDEKRQDMSR